MSTLYAAPAEGSQGNIVAITFPHAE